MGAEAVSSASASNPAAVGDTVEVRIDRLATGGDGVGREQSGRVVFVPRTAPGDRVEVLLVESRSRWARGTPNRWLAHSEARRAAPCPSYADCGGCRLQHLPEAVQGASKRQIVADALSRIGGLAVNVGNPVRAGSELGYRNRVTFSLRREAGSVRAGYRRLTDADRILDLEDCPLAEAAVRRAWKALRDSWGAGASHLPPGGELRLTVRGSTWGEVDLLVEGGGRWVPEDAEGLLDSVPGLVGCHHRRGKEAAERVAGAEHLRDRWQGLDFDLVPGVFLQVNREVSAHMDRWLDDRAGNLTGTRVLDLYAGVGARAIRWAMKGARVVAGEVQEEACATGRAAARAAGVHAEYRCGRVESYAKDLLPADLIVVNPPRGGLSRTMTDVLVAGEWRRLAYVSCHPATLARDLARIGSDWRTMEVQPFDAFPQTAHIETVAWLERTVPSRRGR